MMRAMRLSLYTGLLRVLPAGQDNASCPAQSWLGMTLRSLASVAVPSTRAKAMILVCDY